MSARYFLVFYYLDNADRYGVYHHVQQPGTDLLTVPALTETICRHLGYGLPRDFHVTGITPVTRSEWNTAADAQLKEEEAQVEESATGSWAARAECTLL
jgi:hypothetical protein